MAELWIVGQPAYTGLQTVRIETAITAEASQSYSLFGVTPAGNGEALLYSGTVMLLPRPYQSVDLGPSKWRAETEASSLSRSGPS